MIRLLLGLVAAVAGVVVLREATMSTHTPMDPASETDVVVEASSNRDGADLPELVHALFLACQLEVRTDPVGGPDAVGADRFRFRIRPALDETDRRQLSGCLEDARIDHLQADVVAMSAVDGGRAGGGGPAP